MRKSKYVHLSIYIKIRPFFIYIFAHIKVYLQKSREFWTKTSCFDMRIKKMCMHIYIYIYIYIHTNTCIQSWASAGVVFSETHLHAYIPTNTYIQWEALARVALCLSSQLCVIPNDLLLQFAVSGSAFVNVFIHVYMYVYVYTYNDVCVCVYL